MRARPHTLPDFTYSGFLAALAKAASSSLILLLFKNIFLNSTDYKFHGKHWSVCLSYETLSSRKAGDVSYPILSVQRVAQ